MVDAVGGEMLKQRRSLFVFPSIHKPQGVMESQCLWMANTPLFLDLITIDRVVRLFCFGNNHRDEMSR